MDTETSAPPVSTRVDFSYNTPGPAQAPCTNPLEPCALFPPLIIPTIGIYLPTAVALLPSLTGLPSVTSRANALSTAGTPTPNAISDLSGSLGTSIAGANTSGDTTLVDAQGTPVNVAQGAYETGAAIGGFWSAVRGIAGADMGPVGGFLLFLIAMIMLNIQIRLLLFIIPIVVKIIQFIMDIIGKIGSALAAILTIGLIIAYLSSPHAVAAQSPTSTATPRPTMTPFPTWTATGTLHAAYPTATSKYGGLRMTPTMLHVTPNMTYQALFDSRAAAGNLADNAINEYRVFNGTGILDMLSFFALLIICISLAVVIFKRLTPMSSEG